MCEGRPSHLPLHSAVLVRAPPSRPQKPGCVAIVDESNRVVTPRKSHNLVQWRHVAVHAENPVSGNQAHARVLCFSEVCLEVSHVDVLIPVEIWAFGAEQRTLGIRVQLQSC